VRVAIIGLGLIGGSIGLALKKAEESHSEPKAKNLEIIGYVRRPEAASLAVNMGMVDRVETSLENTVKQAEIVIIATPVLVIKEILSQIAGYLPHGCIATDTGSTKVEVMKWAGELLPPAVDFIGGHPMAGKETYGMKAAEADLFQGSVYCLTPSRKASPQSVDKIADMVKKLGAAPFFIDAQEHDALVAGVSHLPFLLSAVLVTGTASGPSWERMKKLAASGYRDLTRLASGSPEVNAQICLTNQQAILRWIDKFIDELQRYRQLVDSGSNQLEEALAEANKLRQEWLNKAK
jgi:prephenate dehydrogenase